MISTQLLIVIGIIFLITLILTYYFLKRMENQMKEYEEEGATVQDEIERSLRYETESFRKHLPIQIILYILIFILTVIGILYFVV